LIEATTLISAFADVNVVKKDNNVRIIGNFFKFIISYYLLVVIL